MVNEMLDRLSKPRRIWVDENYGNDLNYGSFDAPLKTVKWALKICKQEDFISITKSYRPEELRSTSEI